MRLELFDALIAQRDPQRADLPPAGLGVFVALELRKGFDRPHGELGAFDGVANLADQPGGLRRGDGGDGRLFFQQQHVGLAGLGQAVRDRTAHGAAADDDDFGMLLDCCS